MSAARRHLLFRILFFFLGIVLFYAPFAVLTGLLLHLTGSPLTADAHRVCLRMPFEWALQPWMYPTMIDTPLFLIGPLLLPLVALFLGPLFCGWLCPAGAFTELLGRLVPDRVKISVGGRINPAPIRYGVLLGMLVSPFLGGYICCTFCNFTMMQNVVHALTGHPGALTAWSSFTLLTFVFWLLPLGILLKGGRGFCTFLCPAGAVQGLAHAIGARIGITRRIVIDDSRCRSCGDCQTECPALAIQNGRVNPHVCNLCRDCLPICKAQAIRYGRNPKTPSKPA